MRLTPSLCRQHIGRMFKKHWKIQGQVVASETGAVKELVSRGIPIFTTKEIIEEKREFQKVDVVGLKPLPIIYDENHPLYKDRECHMYRDHNVLLEGLDQAKVITKTVEIHAGLPDSLIETKKIQTNQDELVQRFVLSSHVFDATQTKLPPLLDPERPAWRFPRVLGIPDYRRNQLLTSKLLQLCESVIGGGNGCFLVRNGVVSVPIEKDMDLLQFELTADLLLMSPYALPTTSESTQQIDLPDLSPIKHTITLEKEHIYETRNIYPIVGNKSLQAHTAIFHYNPTQVKNLFETPVTEAQISGRTLMKSFAVAAAQARQMFGAEVKDLPKPILLQSIHTDGQRFQFAVFQLNTLDLDGCEGNKNIIWMSPRIEMFSSCKYDEGKPSLLGYNPDVFNMMFAFYCNGLK